jgi:alkanesulfonate monooxygenase SsuD/methylene tetrahydromethanopterin reductase-like flavin-dependent oxidoreductase (luciferase family)
LQTYQKVLTVGRRSAVSGLIEGVTTPRIGVTVPPQLPPADIPAYARRAEAVRFDELWLAEDCFFAGGIAAVSAALASTERLVIGLGIMPAVTRNASFIAMEVATLAALYPGRVTVGLGHGMAGWMRQIGAYPRSPVTALSEYVQAVRALLAGRTVSMAGEYVRLDEVRLDHPPVTVPPVLAGVRGPRSLELSGRVADGTILAWPLTGAYLTGARTAIDRGRRSACRAEPHLLIGGTPISVDADPARARDALRGPIAAELSGPTGDIHIRPLGIADEVAELRSAAGSVERFAAELPDLWIDELVVAGTVEHCADRIAALADGGIDCLLLSFATSLAAGEQDAVGRELIAALHGR